MGRAVARLVDAQRVRDRLTEVDEQLLAETAGQAELGPPRYFLQELLKDRYKAHRVEPHGNVRHLQEKGQELPAVAPQWPPPLLQLREAADALE